MNIFLILVVNILIGIGITRLFELLLKTNKKLRKTYWKRHKIFFGYHVHHSTFGLPLIILSIFLSVFSKGLPASIILGIGIGIIVMHTISDGRFVFIEKEKGYH